MGSSINDVTHTCTVFGLRPWASADFFPGEGKVFQGGNNILFALKMPKNIQFSFKKTYYFGWLRRGKCPFLPSPADAHGFGYDPLLAFIMCDVIDALPLSL
jgi:hypothetical protein